MSGHWLFVAVFALVVLCPAFAAPADPVRVGDIKGNIEVRLVAAKTSRDRNNPGSLEAKFETRDKDRKEIVIGFPRGGHTTHERTLASVIMGSIDGQVNGRGWTKVRSNVEAVFSIPAGGVNNRNMLESCYLVSLKLSDGK